MIIKILNIIDKSLYSYISGDINGAIIKGKRLIYYDYSISNHIS